MNHLSGKTVTSILPYCIATLISCQGSQVVDVTQGDNLDKVIESEFKRLQMPGVGYAAIRNDSIVYIGGKGYADRKTERPFTPQTRMLIASTSKTFAATAVMQLYEKGLLSLDGDINDYLPFRVRNPHFPDISITVEMLLTHTSSISDDGIQKLVAYTMIFGYVDFPDSQMSFERNYLAADGAFYTEKSFSTDRPGKNCSYSNIGATLLACIVEHVSGTDYNTYCKKNIFEPLGMTRTTWLYSETPEEEMAIPYGDNNVIDPANPFYSYSCWAESHLKTTVEDLSMFLRAYIMGGTFNGYQLLKPETVDKMLREYVTKSNGDQQGLIFHTDKIGNQIVWGHGGDMFGISTAMYFDRERKAGYIIFNNRYEGQSETLQNALLQYAQN